MASLCGWAHDTRVCGSIGWLRVQPFQVCDNICGRRICDGAVGALAPTNCALAPTNLSPDRESVLLLQRAVARAMHYGIAGSGLFFLPLHAPAAVGHSSGQLVFPPEALRVGAVAVAYPACMLLTICADRMVHAGCVMQRLAGGCTRVRLWGGERAGGLSVSQCVYCLYGFVRGYVVGDLTDCCGVILGHARGILSHVWCVWWVGMGRAVWCCWPVDGTAAQLSVQWLWSRRVFPVPAAVSMA